MLDIMVSLDKALNSPLLFSWLVYMASVLVNYFYFNHWCVRNMLKVDMRDCCRIAITEVWDALFVGIGFVSVVWYIISVVKLLVLGDIKGFIFRFLSYGIVMLSLAIMVASILYSYEELRFMLCRY